MTDLVRYEAGAYTFSETLELGKTLAQSGYFQDARDASQAVAKILAGRELGIGPLASLTGIYIVKGRVTLSANLIGAAIKRSGRYNYRVLRMDNDGCEVEFYEHGEAVGISTFDKQDAIAAQLVNGDNWKKFPRNMYFARAISNGAKWFCPDVFAGPVYTPDELGERVDGETGEPIDVTPPPPVERRPAKPQITPDEAKAKFWHKFKPVLGAEEWSLVQRLTIGTVYDAGEDFPEPVTVEEWREAWRAVDAALAAEAEQAA